MLGFYRFSGKWVIDSRRFSLLRFREEGFFRVGFVNIVVIAF